MLFKRHQPRDNTIQKEHLRQARWAFNTAIGLTVSSASISLIGMLLLFTGRLANGAITTTGGALGNLVSVRCLQLAKESNDRLNQYIRKP